MIFICFLASGFQIVFGDTYGGQQSYYSRTDVVLATEFGKLIRCVGIADARLYPAPVRLIAFAVTTKERMCLLRIGVNEGGETAIVFWSTHSIRSSQNICGG